MITTWYLQSHRTWDRSRHSCIGSPSSPWGPSRRASLCRLTIRGTPDRSKLFGSHGQRPWLHDVVIFLTAFASSFSFDRRDDNPHERTSAASAVCSWQTVSSGLFSPPFLTHTCQEQVAHRRQDQVTLQPQIASPLVLVQPDLAFVVLKATLHPPAREGDQKQSPNAGPRRRVAHEELPVVR